MPENPDRDGPYRDRTNPDGSTPDRPDKAKSPQKPESKNGRLIIVSNRLGVSLTRVENKVELRRSTGGLASALSHIRKSRDFIWIGWPGAEIPQAERGKVYAELRSAFGADPVVLNRRQVENFYNSFCNSFLWPLFHYLPERSEFDTRPWRDYQEVNRIFADAVLAHAEPGDLVWVHDFHLMLLPQMLRERAPDLQIGFFLHIPFPSSEVYRLLPVRRELLEGLLGADLIGFQTYGYARHFRSACLRVLGLQSDPGEIQFRSRLVDISVYPIGIDIDLYEKSVNEPDTQKEIERLLRRNEGRRIILGVDRVDHSKGLRHKLAIYDRFLTRHPGWRDQVVLIQVGVPSRIGAREYRRLNREIDELVQQINHKHGREGRVPIHYLNRSVPHATLCALYRIAEVLLVTPIRDGMNLVCQEYVACQKDRHGVLILSEFSGAAHSLGGALMINPWGADEAADTLLAALTMPEEERRERHELMYKQLKRNTVDIWGRRFLRDLKKPRDPIPAAKELKPSLTELEESYGKSRRRLILLDYDGTLIPFFDNPQSAGPGPELLDLLRRLGEHPKNTVYLVSGRNQAILSEWFGSLTIGLCIEHGVSWREPGESRWRSAQRISSGWMKMVYPILEDFSSRTPGSLIEQKKRILAWHYRMADPEFGEWQAKELQTHLQEVLSNLPVEIMHGHKVIEVRPQNVHKGAFARMVLEKNPDFDMILCFGDDRTDEDMYKALPGYAWTCHVGSRITAANYYLDSHHEVLEILESLSAQP